VIQSSFGGFMQKIFVDVDDTLVLWPDNPTDELEINWKLVDTLTAGLLNRRYDITVWSGTGSAWAKYWGELLFPIFDLPYGSKEELWKNIPDFTLAIDDRIQEQREYLKNFERVFLPNEFVKHSITVNLLAQVAILGDSGNESTTTIN